MIGPTPTEEQPAPLPIVVLHQAGLRFAAQVGAHELITDQPLRGGGHDAGPSPIELFGAALGSCIGLYVHKFLASRGVADEGLRIEVTQHSARNPHRIGRFDVHIQLPADVPAMYKPMIEAVARVCPAYNTLVRSADIAIAIEAPVAVG
jgi:ribosomal protein S12 methylthiotransferase accessory factor